MIEDPLSEKILWKEFHAGETIVVDALDDEIVFRAVEGIEPPPVELAGSGSTERARSPLPPAPRPRRPRTARGPAGSGWSSSRSPSCCSRRVQGRHDGHRDVHDDGSGVVVVHAVLDADAVKAVEAGGGKLEDRVRLGDLSKAGLDGRSRGRAPPTARRSSRSPSRSARPSRRPRSCGRSAAPPARCATSPSPRDPGTFSTELLGHRHRRPEGPADRAHDRPRRRRVADRSADRRRRGRPVAAGRPARFVRAHGEGGAARGTTVVKGVDGRRRRSTHRPRCSTPPG